ncbi:MAG TPA: cation:proton antiporter [Pararhizobium sp.]|uniref:cation:proton antiporter n=1 Tax=Pararhizobium sp. TaxID=1977563 RepID=UPI002C9DCF9A|nr:cation:proton antiporter [Pararhizobium sp.]HTO31820.1 cation:proton antiporter [Pararhizobium sp.]
MKDDLLEPVATHSIAAAAHEGQGLISIAIVVAVAAFLGLGFLRLRQPPLVGFILAGVALGPTGFGFISSSGNVTLLAEMGVVVLLFFIGMELSIKAFVLSLRQSILVAGGQVVAAIAAAGLIPLITGASLAEGLILGFVIAMSSTVVAMKMLEDMGELRSETGRIAVGVLIAQDIAVVPMLILVSSLGGDEQNIGLIVAKIVIAISILAALLWWFGHRGKLKIPFSAEMEDKVEILALGALAVCFGAAAISGLAGMSPAYGAFLAGIVIGNSTLRSRVIPVIEPIQSVLLVVFFLSIGLLIDLDFIAANFWSVLFGALFVIAAKTVLNIFLLRKSGSPPHIALVAGLSMAQIGEFSFVLAAAGLGAGVLRFETYKVAIAVTALSLLVSPLWVNMMHRLENIASEHLSTYRTALAIAYARELNELSKRGAALDGARLSLRARYRAFRLARQDRRRARMSNEIRNDD